MRLGCWNSERLVCETRMLEGTASISLCDLVMLEQHALVGDRMVGTVSY